ncbi:pyruvate decarboxylase 1-like [Rutidosis leptorrhynchoides]|uniref:pyruvate decarboxylase 1-like n=1 Tax=Rutidosis leptorrhynchoides TaxID=125765 RepID=UPI003A996A68
MLDQVFTRFKNVDQELGIGIQSTRDGDKENKNIEDMFEIASQLSGVCVCVCVRARINVLEGGHSVKCVPKDPLRVNVLFKNIQKMLSSETAVIAESGDSLFNCQKLNLPQGCGYEFHMQYGSIEWSVGAALGYAHVATDKRMIVCIYDGNFKVTAQDVSTMLRCGQNTIICTIFEELCTTL